MQAERVYLCSELVRLSTGGTLQVCNLECIAEDGCTLTAPLELSDGTPVCVQCIDCPEEELVCTECHFCGHIRRHEINRALGCVIEIKFEGKRWTVDRWRPRHLLEPGEMISADPSHESRSKGQP